MKSKLYALLFLFPLLVFAQGRPRELLHGKVVADSLSVDEITIKNITSNIGAVTNDKGSFTLYARPADTLLLSSLTFRTARLILRESDFKEDPLTIQLDVNVTVLDEVVIRATVLTGVLDADSKKTKTQSINTKFTDDAVYQASYPISKKNANTALPQTESQLQGVDFMAIGKMIFKKKKRRDRGAIYGNDTSRPFAEVVQERFTYYFFTETLLIPRKEIGLFLNYCDTGNESKKLLDPKKEFELTDYLIQKSREYLDAKK